MKSTNGASEVVTGVVTEVVTEMGYLHEWLEEHKAAGIRRGWRRWSPAPRLDFQPATDEEIDDGYRMLEPRLRTSLLERDIVLASNHPERDWAKPMLDRAVRLLSEIK